jgi:hypothetical protein
VDRLETAVKAGHKAATDGLAQAAALREHISPFRTDAVMLNRYLDIGSRKLRAVEVEINVLNRDYIGGIKTDLEAARAKFEEARGHLANQNIDLARAAVEAARENIQYANSGYGYVVENYTNLRRAGNEGIEYIQDVINILNRP